MNTMSKIALIVPAFKVENYIQRCIDSIYAQTFGDFQLIFIDDGSPDRSGAICDECAYKDSRVIVVHQKNQGLWSARNTGLDLMFTCCDTEWVSFLDTDDWVHHRYLELLYRAVIENNVNISQCLSIRTSGQEVLPEVKDRIICVNAEDGYKNFYTTVAWGKLYKKSCFSTIRYPNIPISEDTAIWYKIISLVDRISIVKEVLYYYYVNLGSVTNSRWDLQCTVPFDVYRESVAFFEGNKSWPHIQQFQKKQFILHISYIYYALVNSNAEYRTKKHYIRMLRNEMRSALRKYGKDVKLGLREYPGVYETAFPYFMRFYWFLYNRLVRHKGDEKI